MTDILCTKSRFQDAFSQDCQYNGFSGIGPGETIHVDGDREDYSDEVSITVTVNNLANNEDDN